MTELFLVRHGETDWNRARRIQGLTDIPLNDTGRTQARATGRLLARRRHWDGVVTSPLSRARETGQLIADELGLAEPELDEALVERNYGDAEGMSFPEIDRRFPPGTVVPGRESREAVAARIVPALLDLAVRNPGRRLVVVSHGGAIRAAITVADERQAHGHITNGSIHSFRVEDGTLRLHRFDDPIEVDPSADDLEEQNAVEAREA